MPLAYTIDSAHSVVLLRGWGALTDAEVLAYFRALESDPRFEPHFSGLNDYRGVVRDRLTPQGLIELARASPFGERSRRAFLVSEPSIYGMIRMYQLVGRGLRGETAVFRDIDAALEWLGLASLKTELLDTLGKAPPVPTS